MGRGRAKAKQTKVARALKYGSVHSDLGALQAELSQHPPTAAAETPFDGDDALDEDDDPYAQYYDADDGLDDVDDLDDADQAARRA